MDLEIPFSPYQLIIVCVCVCVCVCVLGMHEAFHEIGKCLVTDWVTSPSANLQQWVRKYWRDVSALRALTALAEDLSSDPSIHLAAHNPCHSISRGSDTVFWPLRALHACGTLTYRQAHICLRQKEKETVYFF